MSPASTSEELDPRVRLVGIEPDALDIPIVATAIHAGHDVRPEVRERMALSPAARRREEDGGTAPLAEAFPGHVVVDISRFEVDLNRRPTHAVYRTPEEAWGMHVWKAPLDRPAGKPAALPEDVVARSLAIQQSFLDTVEARLRALRARFDKLILLDIHSYNHRRSGPGGPADDPKRAAQIDIATRPWHMDLVPHFDRERWRPVIDRAVSELRRHPYGGGKLDCRSDVVWRRGYFSQWVDSTLGDFVCSLPLEIKKTHVDEWSGEEDAVRVTELRDALVSAAPALIDALASVDG